MHHLSFINQLHGKLDFGQLAHYELPLKYRSTAHQNATGNHQVMTWSFNFWQLEEPEKLAQPPGLGEAFTCKLKSHKLSEYKPGIEGSPTGGNPFLCSTK